MKMKKIMAIIIAAAMAVSLAACGSSGSSSSSAASSAKSEVSSAASAASTASAASETSAASAAASSAASESGTSETAGRGTETTGMNTGSWAFIDENDPEQTAGTIFEDVDYSAGEQYHFVLITDDDELLEQQMYEAYQATQEKYNYTIEYSTSDGDDELFITNLQTLIDRGDVDGFIIQTNSYFSDAVLPILEEAGIPYVNQFTEYYDPDGKVATPTCIIPQWQSGYDSLEWICQNYTEYWGDVDKSEIGLINLDFSVSQPLHDRTVGINDCFMEYIGEEDNIFEIDTYALGEAYQMTLQGGYEPVTTTVSSNPQIKYWMVSSCLEYYAQGAARAAEDLEIEDSMLISDVGSSYWLEEMAAGYDGSWKCCIAINNYAYSTPIVLGLRAICDGRATETTLWPTLHNYFSDNDAYGTWRADYSIVTKDTYEEYLAGIEETYGP